MSTRKKKKMSGGQLQAVATLFGVLSEPSRLSLLQALQSGALSVTELIDECGMKQANVSKHLGVLHSHNLVRRTRKGVSVVYEIADPVIFALCNLVCGKMEKDTKQAAAVFNPQI